MRQPLTDVNLAAVAEMMKELFGATHPAGYLEGRTMLRNAIAAHLDCSMLDAEALVETMQSRGYLYYAGMPEADVDERHPWTIECDPEARELS